MTDEVTSLILGEPKYSVDDVKRMVYGQESSFGKANTSKPNYAGAYGPMQITLPTFNGLKTKGIIPANYDINNPEHSKYAAEKLIEDSYNRHGGNADKVLAEYYAGPKAIKGDTINKELKDLKNPKAPNVGQYIEQAKSKLQPDDEISNLILGSTFNDTNIQQNKPKPSVLSQTTSNLTNPSFIGKDIAAKVDVAYGGLLGAGKFVATPFAKLIDTFGDGRTAQEALNRVENYMDKPIGKAFGITNDPVYKAEAATKILDTIGQYADKPISYISEQTGLPKEDISWFANAAGIKLAPKIGEITKTGANKVKQISENLKPKTQAEQQLETLGARSVGAAEADLPMRIKEAISRSSPEKQAFFNQLPIEKLTEQDLKAIENHNKFEKFGMTPTEGQALEDVSKMSDEFNARKQDPRLQERFEDRDPKLIQGFNTINEKVSPDVFETDPQRLASMPLDKVKKVYDEKEQAVKNAWKTANSASGMAQAPIDVSALRENIINGLREKQRTRYVPPELQADLDEALTQGFLTPEQYENFRTDTALIARTNSNPMARQAAAIIRSKLEAVPIKDEFAQYKPLYDQARKATADLHEFEKSPVVKSAISDTRTEQELAANMPHPAAKNFIAKHYSANTPQVEIQRLIDLIGKDSPEHQALNKLKLEEFKFNSGIVNDKGTVSQARLNKQIYEQHKTNLATMLGQEAAKDLQDLADVAHLTEPKKGVHSVNTSNTEILAEQNRAKQEAKQTATNIGSGIAEAKINAIVPGAGTVGRSFLKGRLEQKALQKERIEKLQESQRRLSPIAGIGTKLKDIGK